MDFLNREASRATGRWREESNDLDIIRTLTVALPFNFSVNISQLTEYSNSRPKLFADLIKLMTAGIIDATSTNGTMDEFLVDRQKRYSHVPKRYPFYFDESKLLEQVSLGSRNEFSMTDDLSRLITNYSSDQFDFDLVRASSGDRSLFESGHSATIRKVIDREDLAITRDLLETNRGTKMLTSAEIDATTRAISALYMKNYADRRGLATCTGIPNFPYREISAHFPLYDYPLLRRSLISLGGYPFVYHQPTDELIVNYGSIEHRHFAYYLEAFLESAAASIRAQVNQPNEIAPMRTLFEQFFIRELDGCDRSKILNFSDFYTHGKLRLLNGGQRISVYNQQFAETWRKYVPERPNGLIAITTATDSEDKALFEALEENGFLRTRLIQAGDGVVQEFTREYTQKLVHIRTSAGSLGVNSAGMILPNVLRELDVNYLVSAGICFGLKPEKDGQPYQKYGDVLISTAMQDYETERVGEVKINRGERLPASPGLLQAARIARAQFDEADFSIHEGVVLSGQKLVDNEDLVKELRSTFAEAIGGEMEGNAVAAASLYKGRQWILIKGICDWGMNKEDGWQSIAASRACKLAVKAIVTLLSAEKL
ncbi:hypothetical protein GS620_14195 [Ruegeria sp. HKCCD6428]|nr:hypothetical protein [Ruegeria sp. HKCCD6428]